MDEKQPQIIDNHFYCPQCKKSITVGRDEYLCKTCSLSYPIVDGIPQFVVLDSPTDSFDPQAFEFLFNMEQKHFWHTGRKEIILDILKGISNIGEARILEIGCGNGSVLTFLKENGLNIEGGDIFVEGLQFCRKRNSEIPLYQIDILALPFINEFDIIGMFDVLEHIGEDEKALLELGRALKPGGKLLLTVPAHKYLWSSFDKSSGHQRRYSRKEIIAKLERNGFIIRKASFYVSLLFPLFLGVRIMRKVIPQRRRSDVKSSIELQTIPVVNSVFLWTLRIERRLLRYLSLQMGASLIVLAEKK